MNNADFVFFTLLEWGGVDTLIICAGVSALRPLLEVAGLEKVGGVFVPPKVDASGVQRTVAAANAAMQGNYIGPLVCAVTFVSGTRAFLWAYHDS